MLVDTHAHLTDDVFKNEIDFIVKRAKEVGVGFIITSGYNLESSISALDVAKQYDNVFCTIGFYPENCEEFNEDAKEKFEDMLKDSKVVGVGEIGLQYMEGCADKEKQKEVFAAQIKMAFKYKKPIVIHCREAYGDTLKILQENKEFLQYGGTLHCYSGSKEMAEEFLKLGLHISVGGVSTFKNADRLRQALSVVPLEKILFETDCPYLTPHPFRGKRNEPSFIPTIAENIANMRGLSVEEVAKVTTENARRLFNI